MLALHKRASTCSCSRVMYCNCRNAFAERLDGAVVPHAFPDAPDLCQPCAVQGLVQQPPAGNGGGPAGGQQGKNRRRTGTIMLPVDVICGAMRAVI